LPGAGRKRSGAQSDAAYGAMTRSPRLEGLARPVAGAPGWRVIERPSSEGAPPDPRPATSPRAQALVPLLAGAGLSLLVLTLAFFDQAWPGWGLAGAPSIGEPAVVMGTIEDAAPASEKREAAPVELAGAADRPAAAISSSEQTAPARRISGTPGGSSAAGPAASPITAKREPPSAPTQQLSGAESLLAAGQDAPQPAPETLSAEEGGHFPPIPVARPPELAALWLARREPQISAPDGDGPLVVKAAFENPEPSRPPADVADAPSGLRVFIRYTAGHEEDAVLARRLAAFLRLRGFAIADVRPVEKQIREPGLRYFFAGDQADAHRLLEELSWFFEPMPEKVPDHAADFTRYSPKPRSGSVEVWLPVS